MTLLLDIRTTSVGGALVAKGVTGNPQLQEVVRVSVGTGSSTAREALLTHTQEALKKLLESYATHVVKKINVVVATPWYEAHIRTITSTSEKPANISERTAIAAVQKYQNEKPPSSGNVDVEAVAMQIEVNGYSTALKRVVSGTSIDINLYESEMQNDLRDTFAGIVEQVFPNSDITFSTFPLSVAISLREISEVTGFITADVSGEATEISIIYEDGLRHLASFPIGYHSLARNVGASKDKVGDALSRLALLARDELSEEEASRVQEEMKTVFSAWNTSFNEILSAASQNFPIPRRLYLLSDKEPLSWLKLGVESENTFRLAVIPVGASLVQTFIETGENAHYDIFLSLIALFFHIGKEELIGENRAFGVVYSR